MATIEINGEVAALLALVLVALAGAVLLRFVRWLQGNGTRARRRDAGAYGEEEGLADLLDDVLDLDP